MKPMNLHTILTSFALPLALAAFIQGGSCGDGGTKAKSSAAGANTTRADNSSANTSSANANAGRGAGGANRAAEEGGANVNQSSSQGARPVEKGTWGGNHVQLEVGESGAEIEFDCAHGRMDKLATDAEGNFDAHGVFVRERGGPVRVGAKEDSYPARYEGRVDGKSMTLKVHIRIGNEDTEPLSYTLKHGGGARLTKCL